MYSQAIAQTLRDVMIVQCYPSRELCSDIDVRRGDHMRAEKNIKTREIEYRSNE